ncbi:hypothetical protein [Corynebacterium heidelbergense]|uniref:Uncharacterized protein n=1 Tax=Corynebacterium heidelbergense TaxID=2055947 RepID=A0A364V592_9CORY|nr:hypothetical protein [Corynebacterium heidelbergense]RAV31797.1 hypothetical protein DLJ54_06485 [Corynebacterium heidelbergense]
MSTELTTTGDVVVRWCWIKMFRRKAEAITRVEVLTDLNQSTFAAYSLGIYFNNPREWAIVAGLPGVRLATNTRSVVVSMPRYKEFAEKLAEAKGQPAEQLVTEGSYMG